MCDGCAQELADGSVFVVVLDLSAVPTIDATVIHDFSNLFKEHTRR